MATGSARRAKKNGQGRGGVRQGQPGQSYANRSDLNQPIRTATGQPYGQATAQADQQRAIPLPQAPSPGAAPPTAVRPVGGGAPAPGPQPGSLGPLTAPTQRPNEPLTAGMPTGPGPGPEALTPPNPLARAAAVLNQLGTSADPQAAALRARVNAMLANQGAA